mgnify:CR=1 FL=1
MTKAQFIALEGIDGSGTTTQLARVAALELAPFGVRVNILHPDAVFDTEIWTDEALEKSAKRYGMTVQEYKTKNLLSTEITSSGVAASPRSTMFCNAEPRSRVPVSCDATSSVAASPRSTIFCSAAARPLSSPPP